MSERPDPPAGDPMITGPDRLHVHHWTPRSSHRTSQGVVGYDRCGCGRWRVRRDTVLRSEQTLAITPAGEQPRPAAAAR